MLRGRKNQGITLISLVVTIIILIILAGVSLNLILGENGIIQKTQVARDEYNKEAATEKINLKIVNIQMSKYEEELRMPTLKELAVALEQDNEIQYVNATKTVASTQDIDFTTATSIFTKLYAYDYEFEIDNTLQIASINGTTVDTGSNVPELPENTEETVAGTEVKMPEKWYTTTPAYVSLEDGNIVEKEAKVASVTAIAVGNGETVPVPNGFYYVGGNFDTGVVISDSEEDSYIKNKRDMTGHSDAINLVGNQFVWIPCTTAEYVKSNWANGSQGNISGKSNCYWGTETNSGEATQIEKYGGFYVSRYEAGLPQGTTEFTGSLANTSNYYNAIEGVPQSKAGLLPWNFIDWNNSQIKAKKMYETKTNVKSGLITDTQWDVMINKIAAKEGVSLTDSKGWGNYYTGEAFTYTGRAAEYKTSNTSLYAFGEVTENTTKANDTYYLLSTGASEHNKKYNLYDVAGNLWEWTEESATYYNSVATGATNRMFRGGSFTTVSSTNPACFRYGYNAATHTYFSVGFRAVLYIQ